MRIPEAEGHVDIQRLSSEIIKLAHNTDTASRGRVMTLCRELQAALQPFLIVEKSNRRFREELFDTAQEAVTLATNMNITHPVTDEVYDGAEALGEFSARHDALASYELALSVDDASELMAKMEAHIQAIPKLISADVLDQWQLLEEVRCIEKYVHPLMREFYQYGHTTPKEYKKMAALLVSASDIIQTAARQECLSGSRAHEIERLARSSQHWPSDLERAKESVERPHSTRSSHN